MIKLILRLAIAGGLSLILSTLDVNVDRDINQTLLAVLGIVFSISMSLLVSFNLSQVLNKKIRNSIREAISHSAKMLVIDFLVSSAVFVITAMPDITIKNIAALKFDYRVFGMCVIVISLLYEVYNFKRIHQLNIDIEERILEEKSRRQ